MNAALASLLALMGTELYIRCQTHTAEPHFQFTFQPLSLKGQKQDHTSADQVDQKSPRIKPSGRYINTVYTDGIESSASDFQFKFSGNR